MSGLLFVLGGLGFDRDPRVLPPRRGGLPLPGRGIPIAKAEGRGARSAESATHQRSELSLSGF